MKIERGARQTIVSGPVGGFVASAPLECSAYLRANDCRMSAADFNKAMGAFRAGDLSTAEQVCRQVLQGSPNSANAPMLMGMVQAALFNFAEAEGLFGPVAAGQPQRPDAHFNLGLVKARLGKHQEAVRCFNRTLAIDPRNVGALAAAAEAFVALGQTDQGIVALDRALALAPSSVELWTRRGGFP
jgi:tetratricopeptide (TPR) repeat protein